MCVCCRVCCTEKTHYCSHAADQSWQWWPIWPMTQWVTHDPRDPLSAVLQMIMKHICRTWNMMVYFWEWAAVGLLQYSSTEVKITRKKTKKQWSYTVLTAPLWCNLTFLLSVFFLSFWAHNNKKLRFTQLVWTVEIISSHNGNAYRTTRCPYLSKEIELYSFTVI